MEGTRVPDTKSCMNIYGAQGNGGSGDNPCTINASDITSNDVDNRAF